MTHLAAPSPSDRPDGGPATATQERTGRARVGLRAGLMVALASAAGNVASYALVLLLARLLTPGEYGAVGALLNLAVIAGVPAWSLQLVVARRMAVADADRAQLTRTALRAGFRLGLLIAAVLVALSPLAAGLLDLDGVLPGILLGLLMIPATVAYTAQGLMQGRERFGALATLLVATTGARSAGAALGGWLGVTYTVGVGGLLGGLVGNRVGAEAGVMAGATVGAAAAAVLGLALARRTPPAPITSTAPPTPQPPVAPGAPAGGSLFSETAAATLATAGLLTLANIDVLIARVVLSPEMSGLYVAGSLFAKAAYYFPQFMTTIYYPKLAVTEARTAALRRALVFVVLLGSLSVAATLLAPAWLVDHVAGADYVAVADELWLFAALGAGLAVVQLLVYARLAITDRRLGWSSWSAVGAVVLGTVVLTPDTIAGVAGITLTAALALVVAGLLMEHRAVLPAASGVR